MKVTFSALLCLVASLFVFQTKAQTPCAENDEQCVIDVVLNGFCTLAKVTFILPSSLSNRSTTDVIHLQLHIEIVVT